jgi:Na+(H+)/acetate symporter ActP
MITTLLGGMVASPWMRAALRYGAIALSVLLFLLAVRRSGERTGRLAERLETTEKANDVQRRMLEAAARRPRDRDELAERLRDGQF